MGYLSVFSWHITKLLRPWYAHVWPCPRQCRAGCFAILTGSTNNIQQPVTAAIAAVAGAEGSRSIRSSSSRSNCRRTTATATATAAAAAAATSAAALLPKQQVPEVQVLVHVKTVYAHYALRSRYT